MPQGGLQAAEVMLYTIDMANNGGNFRLNILKIFIPLNVKRMIKCSFNTIGANMAHPRDLSLFDVGLITYFYYFGKTLYNFFKMLL